MYLNNYLESYRHKESPTYVHGTWLLKCSLTLNGSLLSSFSKPLYQVLFALFPLVSGLWSLPSSFSQAVF